MRWPTHAAGGAAAWALVATALPHPRGVLLGGALVAAAVAPWPDVDNPGSAAAQVIQWGKRPLLYHAVAWMGPHRQGPTHSVLAAALTGLLWAIPARWLPGWPGWAAPAAAVGWVSHPLLDTANRKPVRLLWPLPWQAQLPALVTCRYNGPGDVAWRTGLLVVFVFLAAHGGV